MYWLSIEIVSFYAIAYKFFGMFASLRIARGHPHPLALIRLNHTLVALNLARVVLWLPIQTVLLVSYTALTLRALVLLVLKEPLYIWREISPNVFFLFVLRDAHIRWQLLQVLVWQQDRVWVLALPPSDSADSTQTQISLLGTSLTSNHGEAWGANVWYGAFIPSKLATRGYRMLSTMFFTLIFHIGLLIQVLRLWNLWKRVHSYKFKVVIAQHFIIGCVVVDAGLYVKFAYIYRHGNILLLW